MICLNNTGSEDAHRISERIYHDFEKAVSSMQGNKITIALSQGVMTMPCSGLTAEEIIELANFYNFRRCNFGLNNMVICTGSEAILKGN